MGGRASRRKLVGRARELAELRDCIERASQGNAGCVVVEGDADIGRSALVRAALETLDADAFTIRMGRASELDASVPLSTLAATLRPLTQEHLDLRDQAWGGEQTLWAILRVADALEQRARDRPIIIVLEEAHLADETSALGLRMLIPSLRTAPVLWLLTRHNDSICSPTQQTIDWLIADGADVIELAALDEGSSVEICSQILGARPTGLLRELAERTRANPMLLEEILHALRTGSALIITGGVATLDGSEPPDALVGLMRQRASRLTQTARRLLDAASVLHGPTTVQQLARVIDHDPANVIEAASELLAATLLIECGHQLHFAHDIMREAVYRGIPGPHRAALHGRAACLLRDTGYSDVVVAVHLLQTGDHDSTVAALAIVGAGAGDISATSPDVAANLAVHALTVVDRHDPMWARCVGRAVRWLSDAGHINRALEVGKDALGYTMTSCERGEVLLRLAEACKHAGRNTEAIGYADEALDLAGDDAELRARLLSLLAHALIPSGQLQRADTLAAEAVSIVTSDIVTSDDRAALGFALSARTVTARAAGCLDAALAYGERAADTRGVADHPRQSGLWLARIFVMFDRFEEADRLFASGQRRATDAGSRWSAPMWQFHRADALLLRGAVPEAILEAEAGLATAAQLGADQIRVPLLALRAQLALAEGDVDGARAHLKQANRLMASGVSVHPSDVAYSEALVASQGTDPEFTMSLIRDVVRDEAALNLLLTRDYLAAPIVARMATAAGDTTSRDAISTRVSALADANPGIGSLVAAAEHTRALADNDVERLTGLIPRIRTLPRRPMLLSVLRDAATLTTGDESQGHRREADQVSSELGIATAVAPPAICPAATTGSPDSTATARLLGLTAAEARVVALVTRGMTNREVAKELCLSRHTVDSHLRHSFTKVGVSSRVELTRLWLGLNEDAGSQLT